MDYVKLHAKAKINIGLDVLNKMENGYHSLETIMQSTRLQDTIYIRKIQEDIIDLKTNVSWLPTDSKNLVYKAVMLLKKEFNIKEGVSILLLKSIPVSAGLAGGSSDCAAALVGVRNLFKLPISNKELVLKGSKLGADVAFCLTRGTALAKNIGEALTPLKPFPKCYIVISKPKTSISTETIFSNLNIKNVRSYSKDIEKIVYYINKGDLKKISANMFNVLEDIAIPICPKIQQIKDIMLKNRALGSIMSGSGSSVFGIWETKSEASNVASELKNKYNIKETFLTTPFNNYNIY